MDVVVLADTHLRGGLEALPGQVTDALAVCDTVIHAGDIVSPEALAGLRSVAPLHAVLGNNDVGLLGVLPEELELELAGVRVAVVHDSGATRGREARLSNRYPEAQLVIFGHSHVPVDAEGLHGQRLFNPGSPTQRRAQPFPTFGSLRLGAGSILEHRIHTIS